MRNTIERKMLFSKIIMGIGIALMVISIWKFVLEPIKRVYGVKVGDVYSYEWKKGNPFEKSRISYYKVIDMKDGYVLYVDTVNKDTCSSSTRMFIFGAEKMGK